MNYMEPKDIIKQAREAKKLTQAQVAENLRISGRMVQRYEEGKFPKFKSENIKKLDDYLGTNVYDILYDKKDDTNSSAYDEMYERLIEQIEARRIDAEQTATKMESHYQDMKAALERAQKTINEVLKPIKEQTQEILTNSKVVRENTMDGIIEMQSEHRVIMDTLDQIAKQPIGTTFGKADILEGAAQELRKGHKKSVHK